MALSPKEIAYVQRHQVDPEATKFDVELTNFLANNYVGKPLCINRIMPDSTLIFEQVAREYESLGWEFIVDVVKEEDGGSKVYTYIRSCDEDLLSRIINWLLRLVNGV